MVSRRYRRLLQRRLRRRPLLPFLLAATVAFDAAIACSGINTQVANFTEVLESIPGMLGTLVWSFALGLIVGQLGLLGIWTASAWRGFLLRLGISILASQLLATILTALFEGSRPGHFTVTSAFSLLFLFVTTSLVAMLGLVLRRVNFSPRFSVASLLLLTTLVAIALFIAKRADWSFLSFQIAVLMIGIEAIIPVSLWYVCRQSRYRDVFVGIIGTLVATIFLSYLTCYPWGSPAAAASTNYVGQIGVIAIWLLALRSRRVPLPPFPLRLLRTHEEAAPENPERPLERHQVAEIKEINVVV